MNDLIVLDEEKGHPMHLIHPYFAKFPPSIPSKFIAEYSEPGDLILDPFCGSGTTLTEASLKGTNAIGIDANPLACFIALVKTTAITADVLAEIYPVLHDIEHDVDAFYGLRTLFGDSKPSIAYSIPEFYNRDYWFSKNALHELAIIKAHVMNIDDESLRNLCLLCFSRVIVFSSNQQTESRYKRVDKKRKPKDVWSQFKKTALDARRIVEHYSEVRSNSVVKIFNRDSRFIDFVEPESVDLIVTSPPYLNSWDYGLYHRFRFFWLDMDVQEFENREIGKHLRALEGRSKNNEVERYRIDMGSCLSNFAQILRRRKKCVIVNANAIVQKKFIDTSQAIIEEAAKYNLVIQEVLDRKVYGPHTGMHASLGSKNISVEDQQHREQGVISKREQILIFEKA